MTVRNEKRHITSNLVIFLSNFYFRLPLVYYIIKFCAKLFVIAFERNIWEKWIEFNSIPIGCIRYNCDDVRIIFNICWYCFNKKQISIIFKCNMVIEKFRIVFIVDILSVLFFMHHLTSSTSDLYNTLNKYVFDHSTKWNRLSFW